MKTRYALLLSLCLTTTAHAADEGAKLWEDNKCARCHGPDGRAQTPMGKRESIVDMSTPNWQETQTNDDIREVITDGDPRNKQMKPYKDKLTPQQIDSLVSYIRTFKKRG